MNKLPKCALGLALSLCYPLGAADAAMLGDRPIQSDTLSLPLVQPLPQPSLMRASQPLEIAQRRRRRPLSWKTGVRSSRYRVGGLSRSGNCSSRAQITAFVPPPRPSELVTKERQPEGGTLTPVDYTVSSHPTFWVYFTNMSPKTSVQFTLQKEYLTNEDVDLHNIRFQLNSRTGIVGVMIPTTAQGLKVGERYLWQMRVSCDEATFDLGSLVQRITPNQIKPQPGFDPKPLVEALATASDLEKPAIYAGLGIWQDAVTTLIDLQKKQPNNRELKEDWRSLLTEAQMSDLINVPVLGVK